MEIEIKSVIEPEYICFYCISDGVKCSCAEISLLTDGNWYFSRLLVNQDFRRQGIAGRLLRDLLIYVKKNNMSLICEINSYGGGMTYDELKTFYIGCGFEDMGEYLKVGDVKL